MAAPANDHEELIAGINVTPLVDVVLVLLVVLMVTASYVTSRALAIEPPIAHEAAPAPDAALTLVVDANGVVYEGDAMLDEAALRARAHAFASATTTPRAVIAADRRTSHGEVVHVIDVLHDASITRFAIRVREATR